MMFMIFSKRRIFRAVLCFFLVGVLSGCGFFRADRVIVKRYSSVVEISNAEDMANENDSEMLSMNKLVIDEKKEWYTVGYEDVLGVKVWEHSELSFEAEVLEDGTINYPFFKKIYVEGLTASEIADKVASLLADGYVTNPQVFVTIKEYKSKKIFVTGEAEKDGKYFLRKQTTLFEFISQLGGLKKTAGNSILIKRIEKTESGQSVREIKIPVENGEIKNNIVLREQDVIDIPEAKFFISGEVGKEGYYPLDEDYNIYQAIVVAGGFTRAARETAVKLNRSGGKEVVVVNVKKIRKGLEKGLSAKSERFKNELEELTIRDGDSIIVPKSIFYSE